MRQSLVVSVPGFSRQRAAAVLFAAAAVGSAWIGLLPHVVYRVPMALVAAWGLWRRRRWAFPVALIAAIVWIFVAVPILFFVIADLHGFDQVPLWNITLVWNYLYWGVPVALIIWAVVLLMSRAGREERLWKGGSSG